MLEFKITFQEITFLNSMTGHYGVFHPNLCLMGKSALSADFYLQEATKGEEIVDLES